MTSLYPSSDEGEVDVDVLEYDYHQEIVLAGYGDMLHDKERNNMYYIALKEAIEKTKALGKKANVLDIGTGSGLLSMMAAKCGADCIYACESFVPMSLCAKEVIADNNFADKIVVIGKKSNELKVGPGLDLPHRMNILVTEVFDTELIGEGAYSTFSHAHEHLLEKDCIVVPSAATLYVQVVSSEFVNLWNRLHPYIDEESKQNLVDIPNKIAKCEGIGYAHDIQLSQLSMDKFTPLTSAIPVFHFDWSGKTKVPRKRISSKNIEVINSGKAHAIFVWWDLTMNESGSVTLSCAPHWAHPTYNCPTTIPWRDHWLQFIYHLPSDFEVNQAQYVCLVSVHDEFKFTFHMEHLDKSAIINTELCPKKYRPPECLCRLHTATSHSRIGAMNDPTRRRKYLSVLRKKISQDSVVLCLSGFSLLGVLSAKLGARKVYVVEPAAFGSFNQQVIDENNLRDQVVVLNSERDVSFIKDKISLLIGDPFCITSTLPWEHLEDFCLKKQRFSSVLLPNVSLMPEKAVFKFVPVTFDHLWKTRAFIKNAEGFSMKCFDDFIAKSRVFSRDQVDAHPLWEYPCSALSAPQTLLTVDISSTEPEEGYKNCVAVQIQRPGILHGLAIWVEWYLDSTTIISTGPLNDIDPYSSKQIQWDYYSKQGVYFMPDFEQVDQSNIIRAIIEYSTKETNTEFEFSVFTQLNEKINENLIPS